MSLLKRTKLCRCCSALTIRKMVLKTAGKRLRMCICTYYVSQYFPLNFCIARFQNRNHDFDSKVCKMLNLLVLIKWRKQYTLKDFYNLKLLFSGQFIPLLFYRYCFHFSENINSYYSYTRL